MQRQLVAQDDAKAVQEAQARELEGQIAATAQGLAGAYARQQAARMGGAAQTRAEIRELQVRGLLWGQSYPDHCVDWGA